LRKYQIEEKANGYSPFDFKLYKFFPSNTPNMIKTISAQRSDCSKRTFLKRMRAKNLTYLLYYNSGFGFFRENLYVASNDREFLNKIANDADASGRFCDFDGCLLEQIKFKRLAQKKKLLNN